MILMPSIGCTKPSIPQGDHLYPGHVPWGSGEGDFNSSVSIGSGNGLLSVRRQAITWTNADLLSFGPLRTNFGEIRMKI